MNKFLITLLSILIVSGSLALPVSASERLVGRNGEMRTHQVVAEAKPKVTVDQPELKKSLPVPRKAAKLISAKVTSAVSNGSFTVEKDSKVYTIYLTDTSKIFARLWNNLEPSDIKAGDIVTIWGKWMDDNQTKIEVKWMRNVTRDRRYVSVTGKVISNNKDELKINTSKYGDVTVKIGNITKIYNRSWTQLKITDIKAGDEVQVRGVADIQDKVIGTTHSVRDLSQK